jgi:hypothetical protein
LGGQHDVPEDQGLFVQGTDLASDFSGSGIPGPGVIPGGGATLAIASGPAGAVASPSQTGLLLMYRDAKPGAEADPITITP